MKLKTLFAAAVLCFAGGYAVADDQTVSFVENVASFDSVGSVLAEGDEVITFSNLAAGLYDFTLTMSGQYLTLSGAEVNGVSGTVFDNGKWTFLGIDGTGSPDFKLTLFGTSDSPHAIYSGELTVAPVPEPSTYALMLAGLGAVMFMVRRRKVPTA